ncbi:MAG: tetratricopeptide repeat protein [Planctomycetota bacterium]|nr:tetratricopeptide repeat protein [Planctomycetota bacterium]
MKFAALLLTLAVAVQDAPVADVRSAALARTPASLPVTGEDTWRGRWEDLDALPDDLKVEYGRAVHAYRAGDLALALHHLQVSLEAHPEFPAALHQLGIVYFRLRRNTDAGRAMTRFLVHAPEHVGRTRVLGHALYGLGDHELARDHYSRVLAANSADLEARFGQALANWRLGQDDAARAGFEAVLAANPNHGEAAYWLARWLVDTEHGRPEEWLAAAENARKLAPFDPRPAYLLAQLCLDLGQAERAGGERERFERLDSATRALRTVDDQLLVTPFDLDLLRERIRILGALGDTAGLDLARRRLQSAQAGGR